MKCYLRNNSERLKKGRNMASQRKEREKLIKQTNLKKNNLPDKGKQIKTQPLSSWSTVIPTVP